MRCAYCKEIVRAPLLEAHWKEGKCRSAALTLKLLHEGLRPFPIPNTLPIWCEVYPVHSTRAKYEGEPREDQEMLGVPVEQLWVPRWLDILVLLWSGPIYIEGEPRILQRDRVIDTVKLQWTSGMKTRIVDAYTEDLRAVRELLVREHAIVGPPPMLLAEFEKLGGFEDPRFQ